MPENETAAEKKRAYHREYYRSHKNRFRKKTKCKICGKMVAYDHKARHKQSKYHTCLLYTSPSPRDRG